ncbi:hypothetical protein D3D53_24115 [Escherichia coli]|nr:hypothetical protein [Escherichia coli]
MVLYWRILLQDKVAHWLKVSVTGLSGAGLHLVRDWRLLLCLLEVVAEAVAIKVLLERGRIRYRLKAVRKLGKLMDLRQSLRSR